MGVKNAFLGRLLASSDKFSDEQVAQTINLLVEHAVTNKASDIHIEPHDRFVQVRYRIDNLLRSVHKLPLAALPAVAAQLKEQAGLKVAQSHLPQEGQYATLVGDEQFEVQLYTMPVVGGEKVLMHLAKRLNKPPALESLGFWGDSLHHLQQVLSGTHGLLVVATPRRNGKTTTLHAILQTVNNPAVSIATVEDTIEFRIPGASQTVAHPRHGITMSAGFKAALNQDPNIVMLGNIVDRELANTAIQAAAGGHLVLAGMHADDAPHAVAQLQAMAEENFLYATSLRAAVSQRLVRRLCPECGERYTPQPEEIRSIEKSFGIASATARQTIHKLEQQARQDNIGGDTLNTVTGGITNLWRASDEGCNACNHTGYRGSLAIVEVLLVAGTETGTALLTPTLPEKIRHLALKDGFIPMELDGLVKALRGETTLSELLRVVSI